MIGCCCLTSFFSAQSEPSNLIRVVSLSGSVEFFSPPTTAHTVISKHRPGCAIWTAAGVILAGRHLQPADQLEPGLLYFLLPLTLVFDTDNDPTSLAKLVLRLTAVADRSKPDDGSHLDEPSKLRQSSVVLRPLWKPELETIQELESNRGFSTSSSYEKLTPI
ncbi:hypothetical protein KSP39_PZI011855 [Platanthera zijinensis]|uniref:Uncharacterized protein n=1 Tax=Platanthera zijinensis TaxID=2320716 RepID=A0AAP0BFG3_9ASPA